MNLKLPFLIILCVSVFVFNKVSAQQNDECKTKLSFFHEYVKSGNFDDAFEPWSFVRTHCPELNIATYVYGEKILKHKMDNAEQKDKLKYLEDLLSLWEQRGKFFESNTAKGEYLAKACQLRYDYKDLNKQSDEELYSCFDQAFNEDKNTFVHPKSLYTYFSLMVSLYDANKKTDSELFNKYDDVAEKLEDEIKKYSIKLNELIEKQDENQTLSNKDNKDKIIYESYLENYDLISKNIDNLLGQRANCKNLIPLYTKEFMARKDDPVWLKRSVSRMYHKECTEDELYEQLVIQYDNVAPSADTKIFVATLMLKKDKSTLAYDYLEQAYNLETDNYKKSKLAYRIGTILKQKYQYNKARNYFRNQLKLNPSNGSPHLAIAAMYNASANDCGDSNFTKRAVFWLAAEEAKKAALIDPTLKKIALQTATSYEAKAPTKEDIFVKEMSGKKVNIGCWINEVVVVPEIK